ncbi:MAG TPA: metal ABC transporter permease, partial [Candidatus Baltobacteraceae bacterium]|nr:metal ABC transporter permease [Candidatus Baltobacteraceae bacterium]
MEALLAPFHYDFMQRAFVAAVFVGLLCSVMGTFVILRKLSFIGDGSAHASFAGIVIAYLRGLN